MVWKLINFIQGLLIFFWTAFCAVAGVLLLLITWNRNGVLYFNARYLWSPMVCWISGVRVTLEGKEHIAANRSHIYVANHSSLFDIVALSRVMPIPLYFVAKQELKKVPFLGWYMTILGHIFVDRKNKERSMQSMRDAADRIRKGQNVISYPEGTRSKTGEVQMFKRGSFVIAKEGEIDIIPIGISGASKVLPSNSFQLRPGKIQVKVGKVIDASEFERLSIEQLAELSRQRVIELMP